jgi:hypothetical protein
MHSQQSRKLLEISEDVSTMAALAEITPNLTDSLSTTYLDQSLKPTGSACRLPRFLATI